MMNTNIVIALDTRRAKEDGTFPLILRLGHNRRTLPIPLNISLLEKDWDEEKRIIRKSYTSTDSVVRLNNYIQKKKANALDILQKLDEQGDLLKLTIVQIKQKIVRDSTANSFFDYTDDLILNLKKTKRFGTARSYQGVSNVLRSFNKRKDLTFNQITYNFLLKLETDHLGKDGNGYNGLAVYMRTIRAIYNKAIKAGLVDKELYPFNDYKIKTEPTRKRAISVELLKRIIGQDFQRDHLLFNARNYFLSSYMMYGMNFFDMAFLSDENIIDGRILYQRGKTSKLYDIKVTPVLAEILSYYKQNRQPGSKLLFPMADAETLEAKHKSILWARKRYNAKLKALAELCEIKQKLTSYVSRHTFATQAMLQEIPVKAISTMLGHSSVKTTEIYLDSLPSNILDEYNEKIMVLQ